MGWKSVWRDRTARRRARFARPWHEDCYALQHMEALVTSDRLQTFLQVAAAMLLGGILGFEREMAGKPAGLRTHMLVAATASFMVGLSNFLVQHFELYLTQKVLTADPIRIVVAIITGVSFLGAGTILRRDDTVVEGLTTAASLLLTAVVGIAVALSEYFLAVAVTLLATLTLRLMRQLEGRLPGAKSDRREELARRREGDDTSSGP